MSVEDKIRVVSKIVERELGLIFTGSQNNFFLRNFQEAAHLAGLNNHDDLFDIIITSGTIPKEFRDSLTSLLTIGETYFFREKPAISLLKEIIFPSFIKHKALHNCSLRIWSAGCSSGEEPYSIAILIKKYFPSICGKNLHIYATDINSLALDKAKKGIFSQWSFRAVDNEILQSYFTKEGNGYRINNEIRDMISFEKHNLAIDTFPGIKSNEDKWDLILCRNVLMYFSPEIIKKCSEEFYKVLKEEGWFITSQVELNDTYFSHYSKVFHDNGIFYRKIDVNSSDFHNTIVKKPTKKEIDVNSEFKVKNRSNQKCVKHSEKKENGRVIPKAEHIVEDPHKLAGSGNYDKALNIIEERINQNIAKPQDYYLMATIMLEKGNRDKAKEAYIKCLYLNPDHLMSNYMLGNILITEGNRESAVKYFSNALGILQKTKNENIDLEAEGINRERFEDLLINLISVNK